MNPDRQENIAALIDHTLLRPDATQVDIERLCREAREAQFASVCVNPCWVRLAAAELGDGPTRVCIVIGFPLGANESRVKKVEGEAAIRAGASELDMVQNMGALRSGNFTLVQQEIAELATVAHTGNAILKVILETSLLTDEQKEKASQIAVDAGADFVKTSTGFAANGATVEDVALMRRVVGPSIGVKASGGIRTLSALQEMVKAGANRIGTSSGLSILEESRRGRKTRAGVSTATSAPGNTGSY